MQLPQRDIERNSARRPAYGSGPHFILNGKTVKSCRGCCSVRSLESFPVNPKTWDSRSAYCEDCHARGL